VNDESLSRALRYAIARRRGEEASRRLREAELLRAENARLERGLLPSPLIFNSELSWATRYKPGGQRALLGGDFFDAVELSDGTIRVVIGDVCGHGPNEAALGVALRVAWRALALADQTPEKTLLALERVLQVERNDAAMFVTFATLCDIELGTDLKRAQIRLAGHPAPLLFDGTTVIEAPVTERNLPLGATRCLGECSPNVIDLDPGWTMLAFTDGLVERRGESLDVGLERLSRAASVASPDLDGLLSAILAELVPDGSVDDIAVLAFRWREARWTSSYSWR